MRPWTSRLKTTCSESIFALGVVEHSRPHGCVGLHETIYILWRKCTLVHEDESTSEGHTSYRFPPLEEPNDDVPRAKDIWDLCSGGCFAAVHTEPHLASLDPSPNLVMGRILLATYFSTVTSYTSSRVQ